MKISILYALALSALLVSGCAMTGEKMDSTMTPEPMTDEAGEMMMEDEGAGEMMEEDGGMMDGGMDGMNSDMEGMDDMSR